jgi:DNA-binding transcriptional ArsR family regulator
MENCPDPLDRVFGALVSPVRRAILTQLAAREPQSVSELAAPVAMRLPSILKHLDVLEDAELITRAKEGRTVFVRLAPRPMREAAHWLQRYERFWPDRLDRLAAFAEGEEARARKDKR